MLLLLVILIGVSSFPRFAHVFFLFLHRKFLPSPVSRNASSETTQEQTAEKKVKEVLHLLDIFAGFGLDAGSSDKIG